jgi:hypothetical protein
MSDYTQHKIKLLQKFNNSDDLFVHLSDLIDTMRIDSSDHSLRVGDQYSYGTDYDVHVVMDLIGDLRTYTQLIRTDSHEEIANFKLDYINDFYNEESFV